MVGAATWPAPRTTTADGEPQRAIVKGRGSATATGVDDRPPQRPARRWCLCELRTNATTWRTTRVDRDEVARSEGRVRCAEPHSAGRGEQRRDRPSSATLTDAGSSLSVSPAWPSRSRRPDRTRPSASGSGSARRACTAHADLLAVVDERSAGPGRSMPRRAGGCRVVRRAGR